MESIDSFVNTVIGYSSFVDHRAIKSEDASLQYLGNRWKNHAADSIKLVKAAGKAPELLTVEQYRQQEATQKIDRNLQNLAIADQANFATLRIDLHQPEKIDILVIPNIAYLMKPRFTDQLQAGFVAGWESLKSVLVGLSYSWVFIVLGAMIFWLVRSKKVRVGWAR